MMCRVHREEAHRARQFNVPEDVMRDASAALVPPPGDGVLGDIGRHLQRFEQRNLGFEQDPEHAHDAGRGEVAGDRADLGEHDQQAVHAHPPRDAGEPELERRARYHQTDQQFPPELAQEPAELRRAASYAEEARAGYSRLQDARGQAQCKGLQARLQIKQGKKTDAIRLYCEALALFEQKDAKRSMADTYAALAALYESPDERRRARQKANLLYSALELPRMIIHQYPPQAPWA